MSIVSMKKVVLSSFAALALGALGGCGGGGSQGEGALEVEGAVTAASGKTAPDHALVNVFWMVTSGSPDYGYAFGSGEATSGAFDLSFPAAPPAEAINSYGIGVGVVLLMPDSQGLPDGKVADDDAIEEHALGAVSNFAIIYKKAGATGLSWSAAFPEGYSCAKGVPAKEGETFDSFEPVDCATAVMTVDAIDNIDFVNWT
ncbi:MAG: hypothetical protein QM820_52930 [Minicystis sp.]